VLALLLVLPILPLMPIIQDWLQDTLGVSLPKVATRLLVGAPIVSAVFFVLWLTGKYVPEPTQIEDLRNLPSNATGSPPGNQESPSRGKTGTS
jgi:hypothetical protein